MFAGLLTYTLVKRAEAKAIAASAHDAEPASPGVHPDGARDGGGGGGSSGGKPPGNGAGGGSSGSGGGGFKFGAGAMGSSVLVAHGSANKAAEKAATKAHRNNKESQA
jgi:hypothetical protein